MEYGYLIDSEQGFSIVMGGLSASLHQFGSMQIDERTTLGRPDIKLAKRQSDRVGAVGMDRQWQLNVEKSLMPKGS